MGSIERVKYLNRKISGTDGPVIYWMQASVRTAYNHALEYAVGQAHANGHSLHVVFCLTPTYPGANLRHYWFLIEGLRDVADGLSKRNIPFTVWLGEPENMASALKGKASMIVADRGYLRHQRKWAATIAAKADCPVIQVESNVVVPVETASTKEEYSAATIRPKIVRHRESALQPMKQRVFEGPAHSVLSPNRDGHMTPVDVKTLAQPDDLSSLCSLEASVGPSQLFRGGENEAHTLLDDFLRNRLADYGRLRNVPDENCLSHLSPFLHFGHISPIEIALQAMEYGENALDPSRRDGIDVLLEELIVRRELAINYVHFNPDYDRYTALPGWAQQTLEEHRTDPRPYRYGMEQLTAGETDDPYWNACQREMVSTGKMHGYMRMYWGKKVLEWTDDPEEAFSRLLTLNDRYELDGRDPNGYAGVAWIFGKHDRPWAERPVFGKVRYMNANGLRRKFKNIQDYVDRWTGTT